MHRFRLFALMVLSAAAVLYSCEDNPLGSGGSGSAFTITVGTGTTPTYTWSAGNAFSVTVVRTTAPGTNVWGISSPGQALIASPVTHGTVPSAGSGTVGIIETAATEQTLTAGVAYRVTITRLNGDTGFTEFTP